MVRSDSRGCQIGGLMSRDKKTALDAIRTRDPRIRNPVLYPSELRGRTAAATLQVYRNHSDDARVVFWSRRARDCAHAGVELAGGFRKSLYTCKLVVAATALRGDYVLRLSGIILADPEGNQILAAPGVDGTVTVGIAAHLAAAFSPADSAIVLDDATRLPPRASRESQQRCM